MEEKKVSQEQVRKVFLDDLPTRGKTKQINWIKSKGHSIKFIYDNITGELYLKDTIVKNKKTNLIFNYNGNTLNPIPTSNFTQGQLGSILSIYSSDFKIEVGTRFKNDKRDITIIDRTIEKRHHGKSIVGEKLYKYHCNKCGFNCSEHYKDQKLKEALWITENKLLGQSQGCSCCANQIVVEDINSIIATDPWMISYFQNGYEDAKKYTRTSNQSIYPICVDCGRVKDTKVIVANIYKYHSISCLCSKSFSYPEKFAFSVLEQLELNFEYHKIFEWSKGVQNNNPKLCGNKEYDFCFKFNNEEYIIETHGEQHYRDTNISKGQGRIFKEEQENDKIKKQLALLNGIKEENYIVIDCRKSELEWIKNSILESNFAEIFDLSKIDWLKCHKFALSNLIKKACEIKNANPNLGTTEIGNIMGHFNRNTVNRWLSKGNDLNWCDYNSQKEHNKSISKMKDINSNSVICLTTKDVFESTHDCERKSESVFGVTLSSSMISKVCRGERPHYRNYEFKYIKNLTDEEKKFYNI